MELAVIGCCACDCIIRLKKELVKFGIPGQKMNTKELGKGVPSNIPSPTAVDTEGVSGECAAKSSQRKVLSLAGLSYCQCWVDPAVWSLCSYFDKIPGRRKSEQRVSAIRIVCFDGGNFDSFFFKLCCS